MPTLPKTHQRYLDALQMLVYNPGKRFISEAEELLALNQGALFVASELGGIFFIDNSMTLPVGQNTLTVPDNIYDIRYLELVTAASPETVEFIDVVPYEDFRVLGFGSEPDGSKARFAYFIPETNQLVIQPAWDGAADVPVRLLCWGMPNELTNSVLLYDGNIEQINAIVFEAASILRMKTRDGAESERLHQRALQAIESAATVNSLRKRLKRVNVGRHTPQTRLRRF